MSKVIPPDVYVKDTGMPKGRGVFASRRFHANEIVEISPVVVVPHPIATTTTSRLKAPGITMFRPNPSVKVEIKFVKEFGVLMFAWDRLARIPDTSALALGYGSLYNSANPANMRFEADPAELTLRFIAAREIQADEELTINYNALGGGAESKDQNWFVRMNITPEP